MTDRRPRRTARADLSALPLSHLPMSLLATTLLAIMLLSGVGGCAGSDPCGGRYAASVTHKEIDAAADLSHEPSRALSLGSIAGRRGLRPDEQAHLARAAFRDLKFDPSRVAVLLRLIQNPSFSSRAKVCILRSLDRLDFEPSRVVLLKAMEGRGEDEPDGDRRDRDDGRGGPVRDRDRDIERDARDR
jgi:hypothetical protein